MATVSFLVKVKFHTFITGSYRPQDRPRLLSHLIVEIMPIEFVNIAGYSQHRTYYVYCTNPKSDLIFTGVRLLVDTTNLFFEYQFKGTFDLSCRIYLANFKMKPSKINTVSFVLLKTKDIY